MAGSRLDRRRAQRRRNIIAAAVSASAFGPLALAQTRTQGIDVSHFQNAATPGGVLNWSQVIASGKVFGYIKASEGLTVDDANFTTNINGAFNAGLIVGAYHLAHPENNTPQDEIDHFISKAGPYISAGYLRPTLDLEFGTSNKTFAQISTWTQTWLTGIEQQTDIRPIIYTVPFYATNLSSSLTAYNLWIEAYGSDPATFPANTGVWNGTFSVWQKSNTGTVGGITGNVDLDEFNGNRDSLISNLVAPFIWGGSTGGNWSTPSSWLDAYIKPHANADVIFNRNATVAVALTEASVVHSIQARAGNYTINTAGNLLTIGYELNVTTTPGDTSSVTLSGGGTVTTGNTLKIGNASSTNATLNVSGAMLANSTLDLSVGNVSGSVGAMNVSGGGMVSCLNGLVGSVAGSSGAVTVGGAGSTLNVSGDLCLGGTTTGSSSSGVGTASVTAGGTINVTGTLRIYNTPGTQFGINGGTVNAAALATDSNPALILSNWTAGTLNLTGASGLTIGSGGPLGTSVSLATGQTLGVVNTLTVGSGGALTVSGGAVNAGTINLVAGGGISTVLHVTGGNVSCSLLSLGTSMSASAGANSTIHIGSMTIVQGSKLDLADNKLVAASESVGSWNGSNYDGITGLVRSGRSGGTWTGIGIVTSMTAASAAGHLTTLAVATAGEVGKTMFGGQSVSPTDVLVMYTYTGDANLDGKINADDYFQIDSHYNKTDNGSKSYLDGDFNYDGKINGDDYFLIDANFHAQGAAFSGGPALGGLSAVPEPGIGGILAVVGTSVVLRRRNRFVQRGL